MIKVDMTEPFTFLDYHIAAQKTAHHTKHLGLFYPAGKLAGEAGEVVEKVMKMYRDDNGHLTEERKAAIIEEMGDVLWYLHEVSERVGVSLEYVARVNIAKLADREARGVIKGDGDTR